MADTSEKLKQFSTTELADALIKLKIPHGGFLSGLRMFSPEYMAGPTRIAGPAYIVKFAPVNHHRAPKLQEYYADTVPSGSVVFLSAPPNLVNACTGGLLSQRCQYRGAVGTIADGRVRDLQEHRNMSYPLFAKDIGITAGAEVCKPSEVQVPVKLQTDLQEAVIYPDDYLVADMEGVTCVPKDLVEETIEQAKKFRQADELSAVDIAKGYPFVDVARKYRANLY